MKNIFYFFVLMIIVNNAVNAQVQVTTGWNLIGVMTTIQASEVTTESSRNNYFTILWI